MEKEIIKEEQELNELCEAMWHGKEKFFKRTLVMLVEFKVWTGHLITSSPLYRKHGDGLVPMVSEKTGISETVLKDSVQMFKKEKLLTPEKQKEFIAKFPENYSSWNAYVGKMRLAGEKATGGELDSGKKNPCNECSLHCPGYMALESPKVDHNEILRIIPLWNPVNPVYAGFYKNTTERKAIQWLLDEYGKEKVEQMIAFLPYLNQQPYAPKATSPYQLKMKMADIQSWVAKKGNELKGKSKVFYA